MALLTEANVRHLLRRTEFIDRPHRVDELLQLADLEAAVTDVMAVPVDPPALVHDDPDEYQAVVQVAHGWLDWMAHDSPRPFQERMALFWHGHIPSSMSKVASAELMRQQIDLYRHDGLGDVASLVKAMSIQPAMLRYLDNDKNKATSPNQNFGRELLELFLLGVGNYTEADVEAATAAWTGHTENWQTHEYVWQAGWHDASAKQFLGQTINQGAEQELHAFETIDVVLGAGVVPQDADVVDNRGRATREVAAEFLTGKLWAEFAGTVPSEQAVATLSQTLLDNDFAIAPWVAAMLTLDEFYSDAVKSGLVRQPIHYVVALMFATGQRSTFESVQWQLLRAGQRPLYPPSVSGWRTDLVNASAFDARGLLAYQFAVRCVDAGDPDNLVRLGAGTLSEWEVRGETDGVPNVSAAELCDLYLELMRLQLLPETRQTIIDYLASIPTVNRTDALMVILDNPELHVA